MGAIHLMGYHMPCIGYSYPPTHHGRPKLPSQCQALYESQADQQYGSSNPYHLIGGEGTHEHYSTADADDISVR
jgi:hypothetical protein